MIPNFNGSSIADEHDVARRQYFTIQGTNVLRSNLVNSLRFAYNRTYQNFDDVITDPRASALSFVPGEHFGTISFGSQGLSINPLNFLGVDNGAPRVYWYNLFQAGDDLTYVQGRHSVKTGVDIRRFRFDRLLSVPANGNYYFGATYTAKRHQLDSELAEIRDALIGKLRGEYEHHDREYQAALRDVNDAASIELRTAKKTFDQAIEHYRRVASEAPEV